MDMNNDGWVNKPNKTSNFITIVSDIYTVYGARMHSYTVSWIYSLTVCGNIHIHALYQDLL